MSIKKGGASVETWRMVRSKLKSLHTVLMILITLGYLLGTHLSTINSLEMALVSKAERSELDHLDKKLTRIEVMLEEAILTKRDFFRLSEEIDQKIMEVAAKLQRLTERNEGHGK
jgi:hypothetical protein